MFGWSASEAIGKDLFQLLGCHPNTEDDPVSRWQPGRFFGTKRRRDGALLEVEIRFDPMLSGTGAEFGVMTIVGGFDALGVEAEARYASVIGAMQEGVVVQGLDGAIQSCNAAAMRILGLPEDQLCGRTSIEPRWRAVREDGSPWPGENHPAMVALRTGQASSGQVMGVHRPCGSLAWISINSQPIRLVAGGPHHAVVTTFVDVTEQRLAQERVRRLSGLLPVCAWCKSVRNDQGYWQQIELYLSENTDARPTHGLCPDCSGRVM